MVAFAHFAPTALVGRMSIYKRPRIGLILWIGLFASSVLAFTAALSIACLSIFSTWTQLQATRIGSDRWVEALVVSFAPWLVLAFAGVATALANQKLEGLFDRANRIQPGLLAATRVGEFAGFKVLELPLDFAYIGASTADRAIVQTTGARSTLTPSELTACYEHEAAHLKGGHAKITQLIALATQTLGAFAVTRALGAEVSLLLELLADSRVKNTAALNSALEKLGGSDREAKARLRLLSE